MSARGRLGAAGPGHRRSRGSRGLVRGLPAALAVAGLAACEMFRPAGLDPDVVVLSLLIESGQRTASMLALHPHRVYLPVAPSKMSATLEGPGWTADFVPTESGEMCGARPCMIASLPEAAGPGRYRVRGTAPPGPFTGEITVPGIPLMERPADTVRIPPPDTSGLFPIPLYYQVDSATAALLFDMVVDGHDSLGTGLWEVGDTLYAPYDESPYTLDVRVRGIGPNYTHWFKLTGDKLVLPPWPSFGIEGEGVYGYFDGISAPTPWVHIVVGEP